MLSDIIDAITADLDDIQTTHALSDRAVAAAVQLFVRTGEFPDGVADEPEVTDRLTEVAWLLFLAAPAQSPRYLLVSSMHLGLVLSGDREFSVIFDELRSVESTGETDDRDPDWLFRYRQLGARPWPDDDRIDTLQQRLEQGRSILREHHEAVVEFSQRLLDTLARDFDRDVEQGDLSPLGDPSAIDFDDPDRALQKAEEKQREGDLMGARQLYSAVLQERPDDMEARVQRGILRASFEELSDALEDFDRALEQQPDHLVARLNRGLARHSVGEVKAAIDDYDRALEQVDDDPEIWVNRGIARFSDDDFDGALRDFDRALELDEDMAVAYYHRANVRRVLSEVGHALRDYKKAIELQSDFVDAYSARGYLHLQLEDAESAIEDFDRAIDLQPADASLYYNRAHAHLLSDDAEAAIEDYDRALELDPEDVEALSNRGAARMMLGDLDGAVEDWEEAIAINPYYPTPYLKRASMWLATDRPEEAINDLQIALDNAPDDWPYRQKVEQTLDDLHAANRDA